MADSKITALTSISTSTDPANDPLVIVDVSDTSMAATGTTKKVTLNQLLGASGTATLASATITGDLTVDTNVLKVDTTNNRVGIRTASPTEPLTVDNSSGVTTGAIRVYAIDQSHSRLAIQNGNGQAYHLVAGNPGASNAGFALFDNTAGSTRWYVDNTGVQTWSNVGGVAGTAMTLNSTGLGVGDTPASNTRLTVAAASRLADTTGQAYIRSTDAQAQDIGAQLTLGGLFNASAHYAFAGIAGRKENSTSGNVAGYLDFLTTTSGGSLTSRMRIDSTGNVGIGVTPSAWASNRRALQVGGLAAAALALNGTSNVSEMFFNSFINTSASNVYAVNGRAGLIDFGSGGFGFSIDSGTQTAGAACNFTRAMTLDASGRLLVGTANASVTSETGCRLLLNNGATGHFTIAVTTNQSTAATSCYDFYSTSAAAYRFYVTSAGVINATNTTISAISDARLKENVQDIDVGLGAILALKPRKFDWKAGKGKDIKGDRGFIAQEFEQVFPNLIDEWKDPAPEGEAPYKSVRQDLIPVLVKAIQELTARVQTLETR